MTNPWEKIPLSDYEKHMSLDSVMQLQAMNQMMKEQLAAYPVHTTMILGIAGGNGLEHVDTDQYHRVYGVDINEDYLKAVKERYPNLKGLLRCLQINLMEDYAKLPKCELVIANLLVEYIGCEAFQKVVRQVGPCYISCIIQINTDQNDWVSDSPYLHVFDRLDQVHHQMEEEELTQKMQDIGYGLIDSFSRPLPNGKCLVRMDYKKGEMS